MTKLVELVFDICGRFWEWCRLRLVPPTNKDRDKPGPDKPGPGAPTTPTAPTAPTEMSVNVVLSLSPSLDKLIQDFLQALLRQGEQTVADLSALKDAVTNQSTVIQSAVTLLGQLADELRNAADDPAAVQALADELSQNTDALAQAVAANTPAESEAGGGGTGGDTGTTPDDQPHPEQR